MINLYVNKGIVDALHEVSEIETKYAKNPIMLKIISKLSAPFSKLARHAASIPDIAYEDALYGNTPFPQYWGRKPNEEKLMLLKFPKIYKQLRETHPDIELKDWSVGENMDYGNGAFSHVMGTGDVVEMTGKSNIFQGCTYNLADKNGRIVAYLTQHFSIDGEHVGSHALINTELVGTNGEDWLTLVYDAKKEQRVDKVNVLFP
ncbi:MAG: hypothetical protein KAT91_04700 [Candidatus Aenigmarchaeota archaeon]|nr:hypothetical protein [Candidatus Aenigmarchaeota archaeon]